MAGEQAADPPSADAAAEVGGTPRVGPLDGMRAIFVGLVMAHHLVWAAPSYAAGWVEGGWVGVDGFFVLSGFLIGSLLFREVARSGRIRLGRFMARRLMRLYPALAVATAVMTWVAVAVDHVTLGRLWPTLRATALYVVNWPFARTSEDLKAAGHVETVAIEYTHFWSLAVEFQFYLALPLLLVVLVKLRAGPRTWAATLVALVALVWWHRTQQWTGPGSFPFAYVSTETRIDGLLWGVLVALALQQGWLAERHRPVLRALAVPAVAWIAWMAWHLDSRDGFTYSWGMTLSGLSFAVVMSWVLLDGRAAAARLLGSSPLRWLGVRSYSMYLYHFPLFFFASRHLAGLTDRQRVAAAVALTVVLSDLSYRLVERPALALKDRLTRSPDGVSAG